MKTVEDAHRAGARDGKAGLGAIPPRDGPPGSLARRMRDAYLQSYRDESTARAGVPKREKNKRRPCVRKVKRRPVRARKHNRVKAGRVGLFAQRSGGPVLAFMGRGKFAGRGRPKLFKSTAAAAAVGWALRDSFPRRLKGYRLFTK